MKRLTVLGIVALAVVSTLLIGAGSGWDNGGNLDPNSHENVPMAVVNTIWGNSKKVYFGELAYGSERYLMVVNSHVDDQIGFGTTELCSLVVNPGPGKYRVTMKRPLGDSLAILYDTVLISGTRRLDTIPFTITRGGSILFHFDPITPDVSYDTIFSTSDSATYAVNGRKIAVDKWGRVHICYNERSGSLYQVWYARSNDSGQTWQKQKVADSAICPAIAVDTFGIPWISYLAHPSLQRIYLWSEGFDTAAVVIDLGRNRGIDSITNAPAIALNFDLGVGVVYYSSRFCDRVDQRVFELPSVKVLNNVKALPTNTASIGPLSCVITPWESGTALGRFRENNSGYYGWFGERNIYRLNEDSVIIAPVLLIEGNHGDPSLSVMGSLVWAVYGNNDATTKTIRYKKETKDASFPKSGSGDLIVSLPTGSSSEDVQIADGLPFIVWTNVSGSTRKIYYTYKLPGSGTSWATPARVSGTSIGVTERYPHVDYDYDNRLLYVIWTQITQGGNTFINHRMFSLDSLGWDSVRVINPNGPPPPPKIGYVPLMCYGYKKGEAMTVKWSLRTTANPCSTRVYANYNYDSDTNDWVYVNHATGSATTCQWTPTITTESCRIKAEVWYPGGLSPEDISDESFRIWEYGIVQRGTPYSPWNPSQPYKSASSSQTAPWEAISFDGLSSVSLLLSKDGGVNFTSYTDSSTYDSTITDTFINGNDTSYAYTYTGTTWWTTPATPTSNGCLKLMAVNNNSDTAYSDLFNGFAIAPPGGNRYATSYNQRLIAEGKASGQIGIAYQGPILSTNGGIIYYLNSDEGLDFDETDSVGQGMLPTQEEGCVAWLSGDRSKVKYSNWNQTNQVFNNSTNVLVDVAGAIVTRYTSPALKVINDTVHVISIRKLVIYDGAGYHTGSYLIRLRFLKDYPGSPLRDSFLLGTVPGYDTTGQNAMLIDVQGSNQYLAMVYKDTCRLLKYPITGSSLKNIGKGICPTVSCSQGNITYSYIASDSNSLIRLWGYRDDTSWVERDTIPLDTSLDYESMTSSKGLMFGAQHEDTSLAELYVYDPISEELYSQRTYEGYYPHPYIDNESSEFGWVDVYSEVVDTETINLHTERQDMNVIIPELYLESRDKRSPFTIYRDTCVHYTATDVDSGTDSLKYRFPYLDDSKDYSTIVEFYTDEDITDTIEITLGSNVDTISIQGNDYSWYEQNIASNTDTMNLKIKKLSRDGFIPVSRVMVRERSDSGLFMMKGKPIIGPEKIVFCLFQPNPNPFSDAATIQYSLPYETNVSLKVYDISGRLVNTLVQGKVQAGVHTIHWQGKDNINRKCASGIYFVRFVAADYRASKKMVMLK